MAVDRVSIEEWNRAIDIYLRHAYAEGTLPEPRVCWKDGKGRQSLDELFALPGVEQSPSIEVPGGTIIAIRLGNFWYPHMKLCLVPVQRGERSVFSVDTHDLLRGAESEQEALAELRRRNADLAHTIEVSWSEAGLPTQSLLLREYLQSLPHAPSESEQKVVDR